MQQYSAYCVPLNNGGFGMCVFMEPFASVEAAQAFLKILFEEDYALHVERNRTVH